VVDCYAAMVRPRPHRPQLTPEAALAALREEATAGRLAVRLVDLMHEVIAGGSPPADNGGGAARRTAGASPHPRLGVVGVTSALLGAGGRRHETGPPIG
jgi:hypothetical protein